MKQFHSLPMVGARSMANRFCQKEKCPVDQKVVLFKYKLIANKE
jgi:hypothetical protein